MRTAHLTRALTAFAVGSFNGSNTSSAANQPHRVPIAPAVLTSKRSAHSESAAASAPPPLRTAYPPSAVELPESTFLKCIEKEIMDEKLRLDKEDGPPAAPQGWEMHHAEGMSFFYGRRVWLPPAAAPYVSDDARSGSRPPARRCAEKHFLRAQLTCRDASLDPECDIRGEHFPFSLFVQHIPLEDTEATVRAASSGVWQEEENSILQNSIEVRLDVVDSELVVDSIRFHGEHPIKESTGSTDGSGETVANYTNPFSGYPGPSLDEAEEDTLDAIQAWLAERHVDDMFGELIAQYAVWVEQAEYERWLQQLYDYVAA